MVFYKLLGFSPEGHAKAHVDSGFFELNSGLPANSDGGLKYFRQFSGR
jgi:acetyl-CoA C-acetyltransferase